MAEITITTEVVTADLLAEVSPLYADEHYKTLLWSWQFAHRFGQQTRCIVAREKGRIVGFNATMPIHIVDENNQNHSAIWSCDFIVSPDCRGKGIGQAIKDEMAKSFPVPIMSLGISDSAFPLLLKKGWKSPISLQVWELVLSPRTMKQAVMAVLGRLLRILCSHPNKRVSKHYAADELKTLPKPAVLERLWALHRCDNRSVEVVKDYEYLSWRYVECPFSVYRFLHIGSPAEGPLSLIVYRKATSDRIDVVDMVGMHHADITSVAVAFWLKHYPQITSIQWSNSAPSLHWGLTRNGFMRKPYASRFATLSSFGQVPWRLTAGDSDGDFLRVAKENYQRDMSVNVPLPVTPITEWVRPSDEALTLYRCENGYIYQQVNETDFFASESSWSELLKRSDCNRLFMGWQWISHWWKLWGKSLSLKLFLVFIYRGDQLVGILPLYQYQKGIHSCFQFIGNAWGISPTVRSEYISPIFDLKEQESLYKSLTGFIKSRSFNTSFLFLDVIANRLPSLSSWTHRVDLGYKINVTDNFNNYLASLGRMTRLKAFNRRSYIQKSYQDCEFITIIPSAKTLAEFFQHLNSFHILRWGRPCFDRKAVEFHSELLLGPLGNQAILSYLKIDGRMVSASYNLKEGGGIYNIQSGYLENFDKKVSLGTLHMGWLLEKAFQDEDVHYFDFLAGFGRTEDYKKHYRGEITRFLSLQYFSHTGFGKMMCFTYQIRKWARNWLHKFGLVSRR